MGYNVAACTAMGVIFPALAAMVLAVRTHVRWTYTKRFEIEDILIIIAFVSPAMQKFHYCSLTNIQLLIVTGGVAFIYGTTHRRHRLLPFG